MTPLIVVAPPPLIVNVPEPVFPTATKLVLPDRLANVAEPLSAVVLDSISPLARTCSVAPLLKVSAPASVRVWLVFTCKVGMICEASRPVPEVVPTPTTKDWLEVVEVVAVTTKMPALVSDRIGPYRCRAGWRR